MSDVVIGPDTASGFTKVGEINVRRGAISGMAVSPDGGTLTVTHHGDDSVSLVRTTGGASTLTVTDIDEPFAVATSGRRAYISGVSAAYDEILALDTDSVYIVASYPVGFGVTDIAVSPSGRSVYAARTSEDGASIAVLDTVTGDQKSISVAATTIGCVRVSPDGRRLYIAANGATIAELVTIETRRGRVVDRVDIGSPIRDIALSPDGSTAYVASCGPDFGTVLDVVNTRNSAIDGTYKIGDAAGALAHLSLSRGGDRAYVVGDQHVTVLSTATHDVLGSITVGDQPSCVVESPKGERLHIADYAGTVTTLRIAPAAGAAAAQASEHELTAAGARTHADLLMLEPTLT